MVVAVMMMFDDVLEDTDLSLVLMMMFDDVLEDTDLSLVSFYKSVFMFLIFWVLMMKFDDVLEDDVINY
ncbi:hypothetical protein HanXRQr2_Chr16g0727431 [Helianthus annuus]|uniref:Uncharacterized protein n=1 Tax=Helianthus annuus TaxID=4232 RepID=A0A9K3GWB7_HELAN|nr:hypothetical protein HanXRQr2_Chr16g0727431 [Helianthus annuus]